MIVSVNCFNEQSSNLRGLQPQAYTKYISSCGLTDAFSCLFFFWDPSSRVDHSFGQPYGTHSHEVRKARDGAKLSIEYDLWQYCAHSMGQSRPPTEPNRSAGTYILTRSFKTSIFQWTEGEIMIGNNVIYLNGITNWGHSV